MPQPPHIPDEQARSLAGELARLVQSGGEDRHLRDKCANVLRVKSDAAWTVVEDFRAGYHAGVESALEPEPEPVLPEGISTLRREAFWLARYHTAQVAAAARRARVQADKGEKRKLTTQWIVLGLLVGVLIGLIGIVVLL